MARIPAQFHTIWIAEEEGARSYSDRMARAVGGRPGQRPAVRRATAGRVSLPDVPEQPASAFELGSDGRVTLLAHESIEVARAEKQVFCALERAPAEMVFGLPEMKGGVERTLERFWARIRERDVRRALSRRARR